MARLRQLYAGQYTSSGNIGAEFEALVRYLNSAEVGNKTLAELLQQLFDENGNFDGPIEFRYDATTGLQYRIGDYADPEAAWILLVDAEDLRGTPGLAVGTIGAPIFQSRADYIPTSGQTNFDYAHALSDDILCYKNGLLLRPTFDYTTNATGGTGGTGVVTLTAPALTSDRITIFKVRANDVTGYSRSDTLTATSQSVFPFIQPEGASLIVYRNGILQREGAGNDYIANPGSNTITFLTAVPSGTLVSILNIQNTAKTAVSGLMMEDQYTDLTTGLIRFDRLSIASNAIPAAKVAGLSTLITEAARISSGALAPSSPTVGRLWLDTTPSPAQLKVWDGLQWLRTSPQTAVPSFSASNALQFIRVNGTGTALRCPSSRRTSAAAHSASCARARSRTAPTASSASSAKPSPSTPFPSASTRAPARCSSPSTASPLARPSAPRPAPLKSASACRATPTRPSRSTRPAPRASSASSSPLPLARPTSTLRSAAR
jgi:hypothetical protein